MSGLGLPWWGYIILAPVAVAWKIKNTFKGDKDYTTEDIKNHKEVAKQKDLQETEDPRNRI